MTKLRAHPTKPNEIEGRRLGYVRPAVRPTAPRLSAYMGAAPANLPAQVDYLNAAAMESIKRYFLNDSLGCCVISDLAHRIGVHSANESGAAVIPTDAEVNKVYRYFSPRDTGCVISQVLNYYRDTGLQLGGKVRKIDGYVSVDWRNPDLLKAAILLFGNVQIGFALPQEWYKSADKSAWDVTSTRIVGGHDVGGFAYDEDGVTIATWAGTRKFLWKALGSTRYVSECYSVVAPEWYEKDGVSATGLDVAALKADLARLGDGSLPPIAPPIDWSAWD